MTQSVKRPPTKPTRTRTGGGDEDDRPRTRSARSWPASVVVWCVVALVAVIAGVVWFSPVLGLRTVEVTGPGADQLGTEVEQAVGVAHGTPLIRIDVDAVEKRVAAVGPVASAHAELRWPHTLVVTVTARTPVATTQANGSWWLLDDTGKPYTSVDTAPPGLMPVKLATPAAGDRATMAALGVLRALPTSLRSRVVSMAAPTAYDVSLTLKDGRTVIWGSDEDNDRKATVLPALLRQPGTTYNVSDPTLATVR